MRRWGCWPDRSPRTRIGPRDWRKRVGPIVAQSGPIWHWMRRPALPKRRCHGAARPLRSLWLGGESWPDVGPVAPNYLGSGHWANLYKWPGPIRVDSVWRRCVHLIQLSPDELRIDALDDHVRFEPPEEGVSANARWLLHGEKCVRLIDRHWLPSAVCSLPRFVLVATYMRIAFRANGGLRRGVHPALKAAVDHRRWMKLSAAHRAGELVGRPVHTRTLAHL